MADHKHNSDHNDEGPIRKRQRAMNQQARELGMPVPFPKLKSKSKPKPKPPVKKPKKKRSKFLGLF